MHIAERKTQDHLSAESYAFRVANPSRLRGGPAKTRIQGAIAPPLGAAYWSLCSPPTLKCAVQPKIDGLLYAGRRLVWHRDLAAFAGGGVARVERVHHYETVFSGSLGSFFAASAAGEVRKLLRRAVIPKLFENGVGPAFGRGGFFDGVTVAIFAEGRQGIAHV